MYSCLVVGKNERWTVPPLRVQEISPSSSSFSRVSHHPLSAATLRTKVKRVLLQPVVFYSTSSSSSGNESIFTKFKQEIHRFLQAGKSVWRNWKLSQEYLNKVKTSNYQLTRAEWLFVRNSRTDFLKSIPFFILFALPIIGYLVPLIVALFPDFLPSTFSTPLFRHKKLLKTWENQKQVTQKLIGSYIDNQEHLLLLEEIQNDPNKLLSKFLVHPLTIQALKRNELVNFALFLNIPFASIYPSFVLRKKVEQVLQFLKEDDEYLSKMNIETLSPLELEEACLARALYAFPPSSSSPPTSSTSPETSDEQTDKEKKQKEMLSFWLACRTKNGPVELLCLYYSLLNLQNLIKH